MIFFNKKPKEISLTVDFHSHLIPGIDDGAADAKESIGMIKKLKELGFSKLITTPHIKYGQYDNTTSSIKDGLEDLKLELAKNSIEIEIKAAAEYYCDERFLQKIKEDDILHINRFVLFEFSYMVPPVNMEEIVYELKAKNYKPVLAHPERYVYYHNALDRYDHLKDLGVRFQINLNSLNGYYSKEVKKVAIRLAERGFVNFVGSDAHHFKHIDSLQKVLKSSELDMLLKNNKILNDTLLEGSI